MDDGEKNERKDLPCSMDFIAMTTRVSFFSSYGLKQSNRNQLNPF